MNINNINQIDKVDFISYFENIFEYKNFDIRSIKTELDKQLLRRKYVFLFLVLLKMVIYQPLFTNQG